MAEIRIEKKSKPIWPWILGLLALVVVAFLLFNESDEIETSEVATTVTGEESGRAAGMAESENNNAVTDADNATENTDRELANTDSAITNTDSALANTDSEAANADSAAANTLTSSEDCFNQFSSFVNEKSADNKAEMDHQYTSNGLKYLSCSLDALITENNITNTSLDQNRNELKQAAEAIQKQPESEKHANIIKDAFKESVELMEGIQKEKFPDLKDEVSEVRTAAKNLEAGSATLKQKEELDQFFQKAHEVVTAMRSKK